MTFRHGSHRLLKVFFILVVVCFSTAHVESAIVLTIEERAGVTRTAEPVTSGVPFVQGMLANLEQVYLTDAVGTAIPAQFRILSTWPDKSIRWLLVDFQASVEASGMRTYTLHLDGAQLNPLPPEPVTYAPGVPSMISTGAISVTLDPDQFQLLSSVSVRGQSIVTRGRGAEISSPSGRLYSSRQDRPVVTVKESGPMKLTLEVRGTHRSDEGDTFGDYTCWLNFYAGSGLVRVFYRFENHNKAPRSPDNFWDLGGAGSLLFNEMGMNLELAIGNGATVELGGETDVKAALLTARSYIYQDSSGGENWDSQNHINSNNEVQTSFRGYRTVLNGAEVERGNRPVGYLDISDTNVGVAVSIRNFWQNFPNKLEIDGKLLRVGLWPAEFAFDHEVQGGEFKTHEVMFYFHQGSAAVAGSHKQAQAFEVPLFARAPAQHFADSKVFGDFIPYNPQDYLRYEEINETLHTQHGTRPRSAVSQREPIDEYGWRNWGDMMADHETDCRNQNFNVPISHYNNQYDGAYGGLLNFVRTGNRKYFDFGESYTRHVADIDIYHTPVDGALAGGMFWHTTHDVNALTSTHRTYSVAHKAACPGLPFLDGGGPGVGHVYTRGLWAYYLLKGYYPALDSVLEVTDWLLRRYNGAAAAPRNSGNAILVLTWAFRYTGNPAYYDRIIDTIRHNGDNFSHRTTGGIHPIALGDFLRMKREMGQQGDTDYQLALVALLSNADQVIARGATGNWTNLMRYSEALSLASRYAPSDHPNKSVYKEQAGIFWNTAMPADSRYPTAKPLSTFVTTSHTWPYFNEGGN